MVPKMEGPGITAEQLPLIINTENTSSRTSSDDNGTSQPGHDRACDVNSNISSDDANRSTSSVTSNDVFLNNIHDMTDVTKNGTDDVTKNRAHDDNINHIHSAGNKQLRKQMSLDSSNGPKSESNSYFPNKRSPRAQLSASTWSLCTGTRPGIAPRENKASMRRKQLHSTCASIDENNTYMTPYQRKEQTIRDLRRDLKESHEKLRDRELEIVNMVCEKDVELSVLLASKDLEVHSLREQLRSMQEENAQLKEQQDKVKDERDDLKLKNKELELDGKMREEKHKEMYLVMFENGKRSAEFERQDTLEEIAEEDPSAVQPSELLAKLKQTQEQLALLQSTTRKNQYDEASVLSPTTDAEARLRCVRDALFHYLCSSDQASKKLHLNVMLGLAGYTSVQRQTIDKAMTKTKQTRKSSK